MIDNDTYIKIKRRYGRFASWAVWSDGDKNEGIDDLSIFKSSNILNMLNPNIVFCALNPGGNRDVDGDHVPNTGTDRIDNWRMFHVTGCCDYKIRYILKDTMFTGAYMTDIINGGVDSDSTNVKKIVNSDICVVSKNVNKFCDELILLNSKPIVIAFGADSYNLLLKYESKINDRIGYKLRCYKLTHYAHHIRLADYRDEVMQLALTISQNED